jgi:hypothetical protein
MGLRPTQDNEKRLGPASTLYGTVTLSLSSRPERSGAEGPAVPWTLRGDVFRQSVAEWRHQRFSRFAPLLRSRLHGNRLLMNTGFDFGDRAIVHRHFLRLSLEHKAMAYL